MSHIDAPFGRTIYREVELFGHVFHGQVSMDILGDTWTSACVHRHPDRSSANLCAKGQALRLLSLMGDRDHHDVGGAA